MGGLIAPYGPARAARVDARPVVAGVSAMTLPDFRRLGYPAYLRSSSSSPDGSLRGCTAGSAGVASAAAATSFAAIGPTFQSAGLKPDYWMTAGEDESG